MTSARSSVVAAEPRPHCARWWPASAAAGSASTWWTPTNSGPDMDLVVGRVAKAHGVTGEIVVEVRTDDPGSRFAAGSTLRGKPKSGPERRHAVESVRDHGGRLLVRLEGVADRNAAEAL